MARKGRDLEKIITRIETELNKLGGIDVSVKTPDNIFNTDSLSMQEVDGSIRYKIGSVPGLITIETRERPAKNEDITWIQQLITKKNGIGASSTIAVSTKGFSKSAITLASKHNIQVRTFREVEKESFDWLKDMKLPNQIFPYTVHSINFIFKDIQEKSSIDKKIQNKLNNVEYGSVLAEELKSGEKIILGHVANWILSQKIYPEGIRLILNGGVLFDENSDFRIETNQGLIKLSGIEINLNTEGPPLTIEPHRYKAFEYSSGQDDMIAQFLQVKYPDFEASFIKPSKQPSALISKKANLLTSKITFYFKGYIDEKRC